MRPGSLMRNAIVAPILEEHVHDGAEVLDLGGFDGSTTEALVRRARVTLVDLDEEGVRLAKSRGLNAITASAEKIPSPDASFDVVVCCDLMPSVPHEAEEPIFREIGRVLKPSGVLVMTVPDANLHLPFANMNEVYESWRAREGLSSDRLHQLLELANVRVEKWSDYFGLPARLYYSLAFFKNVPRRGTRLKRKVWKYIVAGDQLWSPAPQAHLVVARARPS